MQHVFVGGKSSDKIQNATQMPTPAKRCCGACLSSCFSLLCMRCCGQQTDKVTCLLGVSIAFLPMAQYVHTCDPGVLSRASLQPQRAIHEILCFIGDFSSRLCCEGHLSIVAGRFRERACIHAQRQA